MQTAKRDDDNGQSSLTVRRQPDGCAASPPHTCWGQWPNLAPQRYWPCTSRLGPPQAKKKGTSRHRRRGPEIRRLKASVATSSRNWASTLRGGPGLFTVNTTRRWPADCDASGEAGPMGWSARSPRGCSFRKAGRLESPCAVTSSACSPPDSRRCACPTNPLDILAQHTGPRPRMEPLDVDRWFDTVRRSVTFCDAAAQRIRGHPGCFSPQVPVNRFAELLPRLVYTRHGTVTARPGAQRLALTSVGASDAPVHRYLADRSRKPSRVGELARKLHYESRPGDVNPSWVPPVGESPRSPMTVCWSYLPRPAARLPFFWRCDGFRASPPSPSAVRSAIYRELPGWTAVRQRRCLNWDSTSYAADNRGAGVLDDQRTPPTSCPPTPRCWSSDFGTSWRLAGDLHSPYGRPGARWRVAGAGVSRRLLTALPSTRNRPLRNDGIVVVSRHHFRIEPTHTTRRRVLSCSSSISAKIDPSSTTGGGRFGAVRLAISGCGGSARAAAAAADDTPAAGRRCAQRPRRAQLLDVARKYPDFRSCGGGA